jgi:hypothetical protein
MDELHEHQVDRKNETMAASTSLPAGGDASSPARPADDLACGGLSTPAKPQAVRPESLKDDPPPESPGPTLPTPQDVPAPEPHDVPAPEPHDVPPPEPKDVPPPDPSDGGR